MILEHKRQQYFVGWRSKFDNFLKIYIFFSCESCVPILLQFGYVFCLKNDHMTKMLTGGN